MFDKIKQIKKLKKIQKELKREKMDVEKNGIVVTINGSIQIENIRLNPELDHGQQERTLKDCINDAVKKMQYATAQKMQEFGDLGDLGF